MLEQRAAERPDHPVMHWEGEDYTYAAINREANRIAAGLEVRGIAPGARCAVMMQNTPAHVFVWFATAKLGVVEVPINTAYRGDILTHIVSSARVTAMVLDAEFVPVVARIAGGCPDLGTFIVAGGEIEDARRALPGVVLSLDEVAAGDGADVPRSIEATTTACIMFTSRHHGAVQGRGHQQPLRALVPPSSSTRSSRSARANVTYNFLPFFHIAGKFIMLGTMLADCRMLLRARFSAGRFWADVRAHGVTVTVGVGGICHMLWAEPRRPDDADNPLRMIYSVPEPARRAGRVPRALRPAAHRGLRFHRGQHRCLHPARRADAEGHGRARRALLRGGDRRRARPPGAPRHPRARSWCAPGIPTS